MIDSPTRDFSIRVVQQLRDRGHVAMWAGGCVRDLLLGEIPKDYDVATDATPDEVRDIFGKQKTLAVGASFGVIVVLGPTKRDGQVEVATFRTEGDYSDGRRPDSVEFCTAEEDAARRDFTINGMFYDPIDERVFDYVGGEADLQAKLLRAIGDPHARIREDKLRMLRAVRFTARMQFQLDNTTANAVRDSAHEIQVVSAERIADELRRMLTDPHRKRAAELLVELNLLHEVLPELDPDAARWSITLDAMAHLHAASFERAAAVLFESLDEARVREIGKRLRLSNAETNAIAWLVAHQDALREPESLPLSRLKPLLANHQCGDLLAALRARLLAEEAADDAVIFCEDYLANTPRNVLDPPPLLTGGDLISLGLQPGPEFKEVLERVQIAQLDEQIATREEALRMISRDPTA